MNLLEACKAKMAKVKEVSIPSLGGTFFFRVNVPSKILGIIAELQAIEKAEKLAKNVEDGEEDEIPSDEKMALYAKLIAISATDKDGTKLHESDEDVKNLIEEIPVASIAEIITAVMDTMELPKGDADIKK